jgi:hypothetical protein
MTLALVCACLLTLSILPASAAPLLQAATPTVTFTPMPTRTPTPQAVVVYTLDTGAPMLVERRVTYGEVYVVVAIAAVLETANICAAYVWCERKFRA